MKKTKLIMVGGFLGAGKTSMLYRAAQLLREKGYNVGLITNDQTTNLVDTAILSGDGVPVREVSGSCFCCNFPGLVEEVGAIASAIDGGVTIAEPVGSCTDLSATIMQPLKDRYTELADLAPMTVLADPERLRGILDGKYSTAAYIVTKQFDEADIILINKTDVLDETDVQDLCRRTQARWPGAKVMAGSVKENTGIGEWLEEVLTPQKAGRNLASVDYDLYADGEAAYGWLNASYDFAPSEADLSEAAAKLLDALENGLARSGAVIGHVKFILRAGTRQWLGNLTGMADNKTLREEDAPAADSGQPGMNCRLIVNARAEIGPKSLQDIVLPAIDEAFAGRTAIGTQIHTLIPGRPNPTWHYNEVV